MIEKIIKGIEELKSGKGFGGTLASMYADAMLDKAIEIVQEVAKEYDWILCSERLPEFDQEVLITADDFSVYQCVMRNGGLCVFEDGWIDTKHVLAWQPLPAPYQKGE